MMRGEAALDQPRAGNDDVRLLPRPDQADEEFHGIRVTRGKGRIDKDMPTTHVFSGRIAEPVKFQARNDSNESEAGAAAARRRDGRRRRS